MKICVQHFYRMWCNRLWPWLATMDLSEFINSEILRLHARNYFDFGETQKCCENISPKMSWEKAMKKNETNEIYSPISMAPAHFFPGICECWWFFFILVPNQTNGVHAEHFWCMFSFALSKYDANNPTYLLDLSTSVVVCNFHLFLTYTVHHFLCVTLWAHETTYQTGGHGNDDRKGRKKKLNRKKLVGKKVLITCCQIDVMPWLYPFARAISVTAWHLCVCECVRVGFFSVAIFVGV